MIWIRPVWRSTVLFPAMFGPVTIAIRSSSSSRRSLGMKSLPGITVSTTGWRPATISSVNPVVTSGRTYPFRSATSANAARTSRVATRRLVAWILGHRLREFHPHAQEERALELRDPVFGVETFSSQSFSSGVKYRSALASVCFLMKWSGTLARFACVTSR